MIKKITLVLISTLTLSPLYAEPEKKDNIYMFPQAQEGFVRHVIEVPKTANDHDHKLELLIGKNMMVDCNYHSFNGKIESVTLKGWGYKYLKVSDIQNGPTTMMACKEPKTEKFISIHDTLRRYNSRSPIVVYIPDGFSVHYRIWNTDNDVQQAVQR
jgi:ecotin